ncbi:MAG: hypothetical protein QOG07_2839, partial [Pseudonocardiales bacterium]|nr:hypothetical protein [Pseudonocardiales bacterium]
MAAQLTVTNRDLQQLIDLSDPARLREPGEPMPWSVLDDLAKLVPCDDVAYVEIDGHHRRSPAAQGLRFRAVYTEDVVCAEDPSEETFWDNYW